MLARRSTVSALKPETSRSGRAPSRGGERVGEVEPGAAGHDDIGHEHVVRALEPVARARVRAPRRRRRRPGSRRAQHPLEQRPQRSLVLAQQHRLRAPGDRSRRCLGAAVGAGRVPGAAGRYTRNVDPCPSVDSTTTRPPACVTVPCTDARPSPVPSPISFVVKNGSKMFSSRSGAMPVPVSATRDAGMGPASRTTVSAVMRSVPPSGIASRALIARFTRTCSSWARSATTGTTSLVRARR